MGGGAVLLEGRHRGRYRIIQKGEFRPKSGGGGGAVRFRPDTKSGGGGGGMLSALGPIRKAGGGGGGGGGRAHCFPYDLRLCARLFEAGHLV